LVLKYKTESIVLADDSFVEVTLSDGVDFRSQLDLDAASAHNKTFNECSFDEQIDILSKIK